MVKTWQIVALAVGGAAVGITLLDKYFLSGSWWWERLFPTGTLRRVTPVTVPRSVVPQKTFEPYTAYPEEALSRKATILPLGRYRLTS